ncbi:MAG: hypothetical protein AB1546_14580 [bacterium]
MKSSAGFQPALKNRQPIMQARMPALLPDGSFDGHHKDRRILTG